MRVAFVLPRARAVDGWGRYGVELARAAPAVGIEPVLVTAERRVDPELAGFEHHGVLPPIFAGRFETVRNLTATPRVRRVLRTCAIVHGVAEPYLPLLALACGARQPFAQTAHGTWSVRPLRNRLQRPLFACALRRVDLLVAQSRYTLQAMAREVRLPPHEVLPGGVRVDEGHPAPVLLPEWSRGAPVILGVGQVKRRKGIHVALEAAALARRRHPDLQFVVVGPANEDSGYVRFLRREAGRLGMDSAFRLMGEVSAAELAAWYRRADVFLQLPVQDGEAFEGLGLVYLEAAAAAVPAVGTSGCGAAEAIREGETGLIVPQNDPPAAAGAVCRLLEDDALRAAMAVNAVARAKALSWAALAAGLARHYRALLERS